MNLNTMEGIIRWVWGIFLLSLMCDVIEMAPRERMKLRRQSGDLSRRGRSKCSEWIYGDCLPSKGTCGQGFKLAERVGDCKLKEKQFPCAVPCMDSLTNAEVTDISRHSSRKNNNAHLNQNDDFKRKRKNRNKKRKHRGKKNKVDCRYARGRWTPCDPSTLMHTRISVLKRGNPQECATIRTVERKCKNRKDKKDCKYGKSESSLWSDCDQKTNKISIVLTLQKGDLDNCQPEQIVEKPCKKGGKKRRKRKKCRYQRSKWSSCDPATNTTSQLLTLKRVSPKHCEASKVRTKACKNVCKYAKGKWTRCDPSSNTKARVDILTPESLTTCPKTRERNKECQARKPKNKCQYDYGTWSECTDGRRSRTRNLKPGSQPECPLSKVSRKSCTLRNGDERCFFGPWGEYGLCQNGVKTKTRPVIAGGDNCHRNGVKTKPCPAH